MATEPSDVWMVEASVSFVPGRSGGRACRHWCAGERVEEAVDVETAVAGAGFERARGIGDRDVAVAGLDVQIAGEVVESDVAVAGCEA